MSAVYMHVGIPVKTLKDGMIFNKEMNIWMSEVDCHDFKIEYLKFEEGNPFPEIMYTNPHVAYKVDDMTPYLEDTNEIIFGPEKISDNITIAFIIKDDVIFELYEEK